MKKSKMKTLLLKNCTRDALTGKFISVSKEVIEVSHAVDWCKKQGYQVIMNTKGYVPMPLRIGLAVRGLGQAIIDPEYGGIENV